ncbi:MAG TPA: cytochrome c family protein [Roseiarcus sp.]|jgi:cytochrome c
METTNSNKLALAVLGTLLATMALGIFSSAIFAPHKANKAGYALPAAEEGAPAAAPPAAAPDDPLPGLLAKADAKKGESDTKPCQACHSFDKGGPAKVGPPLYGVVGRPVASIAGFAYSDVLKGMGGDWTYDRIFTFIKSPKTMEPGTKMTFPGESEEHKRADILAYLQTLSDSPVPFPK